MEAARAAVRAIDSGMAYQSPRSARRTQRWSNSAIAPDRSPCHAINAAPSIADAYRAASTLAAAGLQPCRRRARSQRRARRSRAHEAAASPARGSVLKATSWLSMSDREVASAHRRRIHRQRPGFLDVGEVLEARGSKQRREIALKVGVLPESRERRPRADALLEAGSRRVTSSPSARSRAKTTSIEPGPPSSPELRAKFRFNAVILGARIQDLPGTPRGAKAPRKHNARWH